MKKCIVTVVGKDHVGIIAGVCTVLAKDKVNVLDLSQTLLGDFFTMMMVVDIAGSDQTFDQIADSLTEFGKSEALEIRIQREDIFDAMHRI